MLEVDCGLSVGILGGSDLGIANTNFEIRSRGLGIVLFVCKCNWIIGMLRIFC